MSELTDTVWDFPVGTSMAHLHGCVCGLSCAIGAGSSEVFLRSLVELLSDEIPGIDVGAGYDELVRFCAVAIADLEDEDFGFTLLLGDEESDLPERLAEIADWCAGFLLGIGSGIDTEELGESGREILDDIVEISRIDPESEVDAHAEFDLFDVVEHLKVCVLTLRSGVSETEAHSDDR